MQHVIVGNGIAGVTAAQAIVRADPDATVRLYGAEPYPYYRRPLLWEYIAGQIEEDALFYRPAAWYEERGIRLHLGTEVTALIPSARELTLGDGTRVTYDRLLLTTGARPFIPPCEGTEKDGVFALRTLADARAIKAYARTASTAIVVGGGLLGLETARALSTAGLDVTVVEFFPYLLPRQLDEQGAAVLQALLKAQGLQIITSATTEAVLGGVCADCIRLRGNRVVTGDLVLFSTGIRSEVALAKAAGLEVNRGVIVDRHLRTSSGDIYAAGDVAEYEERVYGIIPPAIEQARVAGANMVAPGSASYSGTLPSTTLKVAGAELTTLGEAIVDNEGSYTELRHADIAAGHYRKAVLRDGRVVGAILLNDKDRTRPIRQLIKRQVDVSDHVEHLLDDGFDLGALLT